MSAASASLVGCRPVASISVFWFFIQLSFSAMITSAAVQFDDRVGQRAGNARRWPATDPGRG